MVRCKSQPPAISRLARLSPKLGKDSSKASINRAKEDVSVRVTASNSVAAAGSGHMLRVQTAKVTLAEATGAALKQKHIDQYTQAAITAAESAIAQALRCLGE